MLFGAVKNTCNYLLTHQGTLKLGLLLIYKLLREVSLNILNGGVGAKVPPVFICLRSYIVDMFYPRIIYTFCYFGTSCDEKKVPFLEFLLAMNP